MTNAISLSDKPAIATPAKKLSTSGILFAAVPISITIYLIHLYIDEIMGGETGGAAPTAAESQEEAASAESSENNEESSDTGEIKANESEEEENNGEVEAQSDESQADEEETEVVETANAESQKTQPQDDESVQKEVEATEPSSSNNSEASLSGNGMDKVIPTLIHNLSLLKRNGRDWIKDANGLRNAHAIFHTVSALNKVLAIGQKKLQEEITKYQEAKKAE
ncbi:hypothetical protein [Candidatus Mycoplasma haematohominis]|uniref:hypothetical protein n=1 Tax=Candidatus Mycoplasma haematohominis TaxID=1494318 RepID=UPI001C0A6EC2|nr:hypothetical protein [Candidatus Mycoplasma haemohominis]